MLQRDKEVQHRLPRFHTPLNYFSMFQDLLSDPLQQDILGMLIASSLPPREKEIWIELLPHMNDQQKHELSALLKEELEYEIDLAKKSVESVPEVVEKHLVQASDRK